MNKNWKRLLALFTSLALCLSMASGAAFAVEDTTAAADDATSVPFEEVDGSGASVDALNPGDEVETQEENPIYAETDSVRVIIELDADPAVAVLADGDEVVGNEDVEAQREALLQLQEDAAEAISEEALDGEELDVVQNLTLLANAISANVEYGQISAIREMEGIKAVYLETRYEPLAASTDNIVAQEMTGADTVKQNSGYTGAGSRIAVIDTGTDTDHQSFSEEGYEIALHVRALAAGMSYEDYVASLDLLDEEEITEALPYLNATERYEGLTADDLYLTSKLPFNFNYIDMNLDVTHDNDDQGEHGSHVAGIAAANEYLAADNADVDFESLEAEILDFDGDDDMDKDDARALMSYIICGTSIVNEDKADLNGDGRVSAYDVYLYLVRLRDYQADVEELLASLTSAADSVGVTGVAPDAQIITMKVFGAAGGAYSSDYMAAIEDAVVLGCDVVNLSLGSANAGYTDPNTDEGDDGFCAEVMENLEKTNTVMSTAAGNAGTWAENDEIYGLMYADETGTSTVGSPATYDNALAVASADNIGTVASSSSTFTGENGESTLVIDDVSGGNALSWSTLGSSEGETYEAVFLGDPSYLLGDGTEDDYTIYGDTDAYENGLDLTGKIVLVARGTVTFADKLDNAVAAGAKAVLIYNNVSGTISASVEGSTSENACGTISLEDAQKLFALCGETDGVYSCSVTVLNQLYVDHGEDGESVSVSSFSSWGATGGLTMKPEITAPGGNIYSVNGADTSGTAYETMSGTSMATPHISGLVALATQYIEANGVLEAAQAASGNDALTQRALIQSLMMSTATPLIEDASGVEYSVRAQGAGLANVSNMVSASSFILMDASTDGKVKAELGDGTEGWSFSFTVNNLTDEARAYDLSATTLTTDVASDGEFYFALDQMMELGADVSFSGSGVSGSTVTVPANGSASVTVSISVSDELAAEMASVGFTNGFYVEGFLYLDPETVGEVAHSIPLLGWYGNWTDASMYDSGSTFDYAYDTFERYPHFSNDYSYKNMLTIYPSSGSEYIYTGNVYYGDSRYIEARNALNNTEDASYTLAAMYPTLIRNAANSKLVVYDEADPSTVYYEEELGAKYGSFYYSSYGVWYDTTIYEDPVELTWDGTDQATGEALPEGTRVRIALIAAPDYYVTEDGTDWDSLGSGAELSFGFTVDNTAPVLEDAAISLLNDTLYISATDENYIAAVVLTDGSLSTAYEYAYPDMDEDEKGTTQVVSFDLSAFRESYGDKAGIVVADYAGNERYYALNLGGEGSSYGSFVAYQADIYGGSGEWVSFDSNVAQNETALFLSDTEFVCAEYINGYVYAESDSGVLYGFAYEDMLSNSVDLESTKLAQLDNVYQDFTYDYSTGNLYAILTSEYDGYPTTELYRINVQGEFYDSDNWMTVTDYQEDWMTSRGGLYGLTLAADDDGSFYCLGLGYDNDTETLGDTAELWKFAYDENYGTIRATEVGDTGLTMDYRQSMTWNHNNEQLYWARFCVVDGDPVAELYQVSTEATEDEDGNAAVAVTQTGSLTSETYALFAPLDDTAAAEDAHANVPTFDTSVLATPSLQASAVTLNLGSTTTLLYDMLPWYSEHTDVVWSSSDESIATVSDTGVVTGVGAGQATITIANAEDESLSDSCTVTVSALTLELSGIVTAQGAGIGNVTGITKYTYSLTEGIAELTSGGALDAGEYTDYGFSLASSTLDGDGYIWACEYGNTGMIYKIDPETGVAVDMKEPVDGDMMFGLTYSDTTGYFTGAMNFYLYLDLDMSDEMYEEVLNSYNSEKNQFDYHRWDLSTILANSQGSFVTEETSAGESETGIVIVGISSLEGEDAQNVMDSNWNYANYQPTTTLVMLDNVGRLWYIDEVTGMTQDEYGDYSKDDGSYINASFSDMHAIAYTDADGNTTYNLFVVREYVETPLTDLYRNGEMSCTYHFSDLYATRDSETGEAMYFISLYDYFNNGTTNDLYLLIPGHETDELDYETWEYIRTPDVLYDLGDTGENNIIATINSAEVTGGLHEEESVTEAVAEVTRSAGEAYRA